MKRIQTLLLALLLVPAVSWAQLDDDDRPADEPREVMVPVSTVPDNIVQTAQAAKPGAFITQVIRQLHHDDEYFYRFYASQVGRYWVIVVRADGVLDAVFEAPGPAEPLTTD